MCITSNSTQEVKFIFDVKDLLGEKLHHNVFTDVFKVQEAYFLLQLYQQDPLVFCFLNLWTIMLATLCSCGFGWLYIIQKNLLWQLCENVTIQKSEAVWVTRDSLCHVWHLEVKVQIVCSEIFRKVFSSPKIQYTWQNTFCKTHSI